ncbi:MAG: glycosyltransferase [Fibrobacteria bacterium]|nr:glycosyltransferase [Fibrobacteria bacterium]
MSVLMPGDVNAKNESSEQIERPAGISIIIVSYNSKHVLAPCLDSLIHAGRYFSGQHEIIIVDNNSKDGTVDLLRPKYGDAIWIPLDKNLGFGSGCNRGALSAQYQQLLFLNPDTIVEEQTLEAMWEFFHLHGDAGIAGCKIRNKDNSLQLACRRSFPTLKIAGFRLLGLSRLFPKSKLYAQYNLTYLDDDIIHEVDAVSGSFLCIPNTTFRKVNGFDEDFFMYGEDLDLCYRVKLLGYKNYYTPDTSVLHFKGESSKSRPLRSLFHFYSAMIIFSRKHFELRMFPLVVVYAGVISLGFVRFISGKWNKWPRWAFDLVLVNTVLAVVTIAYSKINAYPHIIFSKWLLYVNWHLLLSCCVLGFLGVFEDYSKPHRNSKSFSPAIALAVLSFFAVGYFFYEGSFSRIVMGVSGLLSAIALFGWRAMALQGNLLFGKVLFPRKRIVIMGINERSLLLKELILKGQLAGYELMGFMPGSPLEVTAAMKSEIIGDSDNFSFILNDLEVHEIIIALDENAYQTALKLLSDEKLRGIPIKILVGQPKPRSITLVDLNYNR